MDSKRSRWLIGGMIIAAIGCAISIYSTLHHVEVKQVGFTDAVCNINETFSCDDVAKSEYSELFGVPLGVYGFGYFLGLMLLCGMTIWQKDDDYLEGPLAYKAMVGIGVLVSLVLGIISWISVGTLCLTCMGIYGVCFLQAGWLFLHRSATPEKWKSKPLINGGITATIALLLTITTYNFTLGAGVESTPDKPADSVAQDSKPFDIAINFSPYSGLGEDYRKGSDSAGVVIVKFSDFQCPACGVTARVLKKLAEEYGDKILIVYKNYPLSNKCNDNIGSSMHTDACDAAILARCAGNQGKFWQFSDLVFANQSNISASMLRTTAKAVGLGDADIDACLQSPDILAKIKEDIAQGEAAKVTGTPSLYLNGRKMQGGRSIDDFRRAVDRALSRL
ncbi:thioredoxin domain-containing protein [Oligoflexaceae bacterium]|nr:thioredoxin domain-containing protein [Oligoflexaceae bacterium]